MSQGRLVAVAAAMLLPGASTMTIPIICIAGPTGTGKTAASLHLADGIRGAVVNFDSRQVYADFPIITAQPTAEERSRCPHRLYGFLPLTRSMAAGAWADMALDTVDELRGRGLVPIFVGGTGLYLKALLEPLAPIPAVPEALRQRIQDLCDREGAPRLHERLRRVDPVYAGRIHPNDRQRVTRALEVYEHTAKPISCWHAEYQGQSPFRALKLGLAMDPAELAPRLARRVDLMLESGALDEARAAMAHNDDPDAPGWSGIGCAELLDHLKGRCTLEAARGLWVRNTRLYAKRQMTWFKKDQDMRWFEPGQEGAMLTAARAFLTEPEERGE